MKIAIFGSRRQHNAAEYIRRFISNLRERRVQIVMHPKLFRHLSEIAPDIVSSDIEVSEEEHVFADLAVSLGGDGTFLRTAMWTEQGRVPVVGVNTGHLGYLAALSVEQLPDLISMIENDAFRIEQRSLLEVDIPGLPEAVGRYALNEFSLMKEESASMITAAVDIDGAPLADYRADGLIVCTSTGSTAYNLSVGGPIVQPTVDVFVISPVAAHSLSMRPMVIGGDSSISILTSGRTRHVRIALDGRSAIIDNGTPIHLSKANFTLPVMQLANHTFADSLRDKLHWSE